VLDRLRANRESFARFGVKSLSLFGSTARDEAGPDSDVDVLVEFEGRVSFDGYMGLKHFLEDLLGTSVDVVTPSGLKPRIRPQVERDTIRVT
jgi:hypothetical protein